MRIKYMKQGARLTASKAEQKKQNFNIKLSKVSKIF